MQLLVQRIDVREEVMEVRIRAEGLASLVGELRHDAGRRDETGRQKTLVVRIPMRFQR